MIDKVQENKVQEEFSNVKFMDEYLGAEGTGKVAMIALSILLGSAFSLMTGDPKGILVAGGAGSVLAFAYYYTILGDMAICDEKDCIPCSDVTEKIKNLDFTRTVSKKA